MAFGNASLPTRKYTYGVREFLPHSRDRFPGHDQAVDQLRKANRFQNKLVELERARREACEQAIRDYAPDLLVLERIQAEQEARLTQLQSDIKAANAAARAVLPQPELKRLARDQAAVTQAARRAFRDRRKAIYADPSVRCRLDDIDADFQNRVKDARAAAIADGLYWCTAALVTTRVKRTGPPPKYKRFEGTGQLGVQLQRKADKTTPRVPVLNPDGTPRLGSRSRKPMFRHEGGGSMSTDKVTTPNTLVWIESQGLENKKYVWVHLRVGSLPNGSPVWAKLPVKMHRPLPPGAEIKWAYLVCRRYGTHFRWEVQFDVAKPAWTFPHPRAESGTVAVALGWRWIAGQIRVATWVGDDGVQGEVNIPKDRVDSWKRCEDMQSTRDDMFNVSRAALLRFLDGRTLPEEWQHRTETLAQWRSCGRFAALVRWWRDHRLSGDEGVFRLCEGELFDDHYTGGRRQDRHLCDWQAWTRRKNQNWRKHFFREIALYLAATYKTAVVADIDWHEIAENPTPESDEDRVNKRNRGIAACASFRDHLQACMDVVREPAEMITRTCHQCGHICPDPKEGRWVVCEPCGVNGRMDRAVNAANNLLQRRMQTEAS